MNQNQNPDPNQYQSPPQNPTQGYAAAPAKPVITAADIPLALKARYFGSGFVVGVFVSPLVRNTVGKLQPKFDQLLDNLTGQAESLVEKSTDILAKAKDVLRKAEAKEDAHDHAHEDAHDHAHDEAAGARTKAASNN